MMALKIDGWYADPRLCDKNDFPNVRIYYAAESLLPRSRGHHDRRFNLFQGALGCNHNFRKHQSRVESLVSLYRCYFYFLKPEHLDRERP